MMTLCNLLCLLWLSSNPVTYVHLGSGAWEEVTSLGDLAKGITRVYCVREGMSREQVAEILGPGYAVDGYGDGRLGGCHMCHYVPGVSVTVLIENGKVKTVKAFPRSRPIEF